MTFSDNDTGPFGVSLARSEAPLSRFDLRRVVCCTDSQCAFQTMHALQKEVNAWGQMVSYQKERDTAPSARSQYQALIRVGVAEVKYLVL